MAGHLAAAGHQVTVYNRTASRAADWVERHGHAAAATPAGAAEGAEIVFACVGNDDDLRGVTTGPGGAFETLAPGAVFVDHTTASAEVARELAARRPSAARASSTRRSPAARPARRSGELTVMCGGDAGDYARVEPVIAAYARACRLMGPAGAGQLTKMVNQICIAGLLQGLSEGLAFAQKAGLDGLAVLDVIGKGAAGSWQMENRGPTMLEDKFDFGFAVDWMRKDLAICLDEAERNGAALPATALIDQFYKDVQAMGGGRSDTSSLIRRLT